MTNTPEMKTDVVISDVDAPETTEVSKEDKIDKEVANTTKKIVNMSDKEKEDLAKAVKNTTAFKEAEKDTSAKGLNKVFEMIKEFFEKLNMKIGGFEKDAEDKDHKSTTNDKKDISKSNISEKSEKWGNSLLGNAKQFLGVAEGQDENLIRKFHKAAGLNAGSKSHWCASFVSYVLKQSGVNVPGNARSKAWLDQGQTISKKEVQAGDVIIFNRGTNAANGHIGFATGNWKNGHPEIIAGNTSDKVKQYYEKESIVGYRRFAA